MKKNDFRPKAYPANLCTWKGKSGVTEISHLAQGDKSSLFSRVYDDACDVGLTLIGRTREIVFVITEIEKDSEGDLIYYELTSISEPGWTITIFND